MKLLLYCTKAKPYLVQGSAKPMHTLDANNPFNFNWKLVKKGFSNDRLNGKIVAECDFEVEEIGLVEIPDYAGVECHTFVYDVSIYFETKTLNQDKLFKNSCLNWEEMEKYLYSTNGKGYAIHIKNLHIFDEPKKLRDYYNYYTACSILKAPQNMMYATSDFEDYRGIGLPKDKYIIISIQPQWLCKILNGEKTIEVRKKILKEMLK